MKKLRNEASQAMRKANEQHQCGTADSRRLEVRLATCVASNIGIG